MKRFLCFLVWLNVKLANSCYKQKPSEKNKKMLLHDYAKYKEYGGKKIFAEAERLILSE